MSVQTHTLQLEDVGSWWVLQQARARENDGQFRFDSQGKKSTHPGARTGDTVYRCTELRDRIHKGFHYNSSVQCKCISKQSLGVNVFCACWHRVLSGLVEHPT
jgi:hypothetical protein